MRESLKRGADEAEVFAIHSRNLSVEVKKGEIDSLEKSVDSGYSVRIIKGGKQGFSFSTNSLDYKKCIETAFETARWTEDDRFIGFPLKGTYQQVRVFDPSVDALGEKELKEFALIVENAAFHTDKRITKTRKTSVNLSSGETIIMNSRGIAESYRSTSINSHIMVIAEDGKDSQTGWDYQGSRFLEVLSFDEIGKTGAERAIRLLGAKKIKPAKTDIILENSVATEFLSILASSLLSESVQKGKSLLAGKMGTQVLSERIDVADNALMDKQNGSKPFDAEGVATKNKTLIENGVLKGYLYNTYTAKKDNTSSTGNAARRGLSSVPSVGVTNLFLKPSGHLAPRPMNTLIASVDRGLFVTEAMGIHTANPISGDFSVGVSGIWVRGGEFLHPVKEAVISGNILGLFKNVMECCDDLTFYGKIGSPSLLIKDIDISG